MSLADLLNMIEPDLEGQIPEPTTLAKCLACMNLSPRIDEVLAFVEHCATDKSNEQFIAGLRHTISQIGILDPMGDYQMNTVGH